MASSFGSFESIREVYADATYTVYEARKSGDPKTEYAIKLFSIQRTEMDAESAAALSGLISDIERACAQRISLQQQAAAHPEFGKFISPVLESGQDERGVWYVTPYFPRSVNKIISGKVALSPDALEHVIRSVVQGALAMKQTCGRSHGEIQPSNIQISRSDSLTDATVVLSDPLAGDASEAVRYEKSDLRAIGELIYQLVHKKKVDFAWIMVPLDPTPDWEEMLGKKNAARWIDICNRLLDPNLSLETLNLEILDEQLQGRRGRRKPAKAVAPGEPRGVPGEAALPAGPGSKKVALFAAAVAGILVLGAGGIFVVKWIGNSARERSARAHQAVVEEVKRLIAQGECLGARDKLSAGKFSESETRDLRMSVDECIETAYQAATNRASAALRQPQPDYQEAVKQAELASRFKPGDEVAGNLKALGQKGLDAQAQAANCNDAKEKARKAEGDRNWQAARSAWQQAQRLCGENKEVSEGIKFATALATVETKLNEVGAKVRGTLPEAKDATNLCAQLIAKLQEVKDLAQNPARQPAHLRLESDVNSNLAAANNRIGELTQTGVCAEAKQLARDAEQKGDWPAAVQAWQAAQSKCRTDKEVLDGTDFAKAIAQAQGTLDQAGKAATTQAQAALAGTSCRDLLGKLAELQSLASGNGSRQRALEANTRRATQILETAQTTLQGAEAQRRCNQAKAAAQEAEQRNDWGAARVLWDQAKADCRDERTVADGLRFAQAMTNAAAQLDQARTKAAGPQNEARQAADLAAQVLTQLAEVSALTNSNPARQRQIEFQAKSARDITTSLAKADQDAKLLASFCGWLDKGDYRQILETPAPDNEAFRKIRTGAATLKSASEEFKECKYSFVTSALFLQFKETNSFRRLLKEATTERDMARQLNGLLAEKKYADIEQWFSTNKISKSCLLQIQNTAACAEASRQAGEAEQNTNWTAAVRLWTAAQKKCLDDPAIARNISFSKAMESAAGWLAQGKAEQAMAAATEARTLRPNDASAANLQELAKKTFEDADYLSASNSLAACQYAAAVDVCRKHPDSARLQTLRTQAEALDQAVRQAGDDLAQGRWEQVLALQASAGNNRCIANLIRSAGDEKAQWEPLIALTNQASWSLLNSRMAGINPDLRKKPPFAALDQWLASNNPLTLLDSQLALYKVFFGVMKNTKGIIDPNTGKPAKEFTIEVPQGDWINVLKALRSSYERLGVPFDTQKADLKAVEDAIGKH